MAFQAIIVFFLLGFVKCSPPGPVVQCSHELKNCTVSNAYGSFPDRSICKAAEVVYPSTEDELLASVAVAVRKNQKMRVVTRYSHSIPKLVCPGGESGLIISTRDLDRVVSVDKPGMTMTFESGIALENLIDAAAKEGLALPHSPYWLGVTLGGMLGTGSHGSSLFGKGSAVHEYVVGMRLVVPASHGDGYAKVVNITEADEDLNAAKVSLGVLGVISQILEIRIDVKEVEELANNAEAKCVLSQIQVAIIFGIGTGLENKDSLFLGYPVIGYQNKMQSAGSCLSSPEDGLETTCGWDPRIKGLFYFQNGFSVGLSKIQQFLFDIKKLRDLIPSSLCGIELYYGILMRYVKASSAYLGNQEDSVDLDITYYRAHDPNTPRLYEDVLEEIEQMALVKYGALPHWGKNRNIAFDAVMKKYKKYEAFLAAKSKYDPKGLFSSEWTDGVLGVGKEGVIIKKNGCALEGLCVCSEDAHCSPEKGYFCRPGRVYTEARVCRREGT
eukprot:PITA_01060